MPEAGMLRLVKQYRAEKQAEMARFASLCDRYDNLYYPNSVGVGGADHWPNDESARITGRVHISVNVYPAYVDIPAALQSVEPIENIIPLDSSPQGQSLAAAIERTYFAWKDVTKFELKSHKACVVKGLYGRTAAKVYWDEAMSQPNFRIIDQPRNLWLGWATDDYERLEWAIYSYRISVNEAIAQYGVEVDMVELTEDKGKIVRLPFFRQRSRDVLAENQTSVTARDWLTDDIYMVECVDFWYRAPRPDVRIEPGKPTPMDTWNAILVGNMLVKDMPHPEYEGRLPYVPLFNTYIPGVPEGRSDLFDVEQLIREKDERLSAGGQMIRKAIAGQYWQLRGNEAPDEVPVDLKPKEETVVAPGAGNWIESIQPFIPEFQLEQYLTRIDRELVDVSGLNDLLRGLAPSAVLSSSKAINALVANYEMRIRMKRDMFYEWRRDIWNLVKVVWGKKDRDIGLALAMAGDLEVRAPSITPRDDLETATMAMNLLNARIWSLGRAQDTTGVDDPEGETEQIKRERTDASLFPEQVTQQVGLLAALQQMGIQQQQMGGGGQPQMGDALNAQRQQMAGFVGSPMMNGTGEQVATPPGALPPEAGNLPPSGPGQNFSAQTQIGQGEANSRLLLENPIAPEGQ